MKQTLTYALLIVVSIYAVVTTFQKVKIKNLYQTEIDKQKVILSDSIGVLNLQLKDLTLKQQIWTKNVQNETDQNHNKLIQDEKTIDNSVVTDSKRDSVRAKYEGSR